MKEAAIIIRLGIGDLVFIEPGIRLLLMNGFTKVHLFCRSDGMNIYHAYHDVQTHPLNALKRYKPADDTAIIYISTETHGDMGNRTTAFTESIVSQAGLDISVPMNLAPQLPVDKLHSDWAEMYLKRKAGQDIYLWQMESSRSAKSLPRETSMAAIQMLLSGGSKVVVLTDNHQGFPRHKNLKLLRGISMERFMGICKNVTRVVALDSAPSWIAGAVGADTIAIFGPTDPALYCPRADNIHILRWNSGCLEMPCGRISGCHIKHTCMEIPAPLLVQEVTAIELSHQMSKYHGPTETFTNLSQKSSIGIGNVFLMPGETLTIPITPELKEGISGLIKKGLLRREQTADGGMTRGGSLFRWSVDISQHLHPHNDSIAIIGLEGMGGTVALSDIAKKVKEKYAGKKVTLIIRNYGELFDDNPYVDEVIHVGIMSYLDCLKTFQDKFYAIADQRFAMARWYGAIENEYELSPFMNQLYYNHPLGQAALGAKGKHYLQIVDEILCLPSDTVESKIYFDSPKPDIDGDYIVITNGVDVWHQGLRQTKCWPYWADLVKLIDVQFVQVGTHYDLPVPGAIDLRGMTDIKGLCAILKHAYAIMVTEGGIMHMAYALGCENVIVVRGPTASPLLKYPGQVCIDSMICEPCMFSTGLWYEKCPQGFQEPTCMYSITPERVVSIYENMVSGELQPTM